MMLRLVDGRGGPLANLDYPLDPRLPARSDCYLYGWMCVVPAADDECLHRIPSRDGGENFCSRV